jgi:hypothetical protein
MTAELLAKRAHARPAGPDRWRAKCPVHGGKSFTSLGIARGENGRVLVKCWSGCAVEDICGAMGIAVKDLFSESNPVQVKPQIVRNAERQIADLPSRLTATERNTLEPVVILTTLENLDAAICRGLALSVEGELCQIILKEQHA